MFRKLVLYPLAVVVLLAGIYLAVVIKWSYSSGERAGWVQKFSRKGWVCKTWEGEIAMVTLPGSVPEKFAFTVRDEDVAAQITRSVGQRVALHYEQHRGLPGDCLGETEYWVDSVSPAAMPAYGIGPGAQPDSAPAPAVVTPAPVPSPAIGAPTAPAGAPLQTPAAPPPAPVAPAAPQPAH